MFRLLRRVLTVSFFLSVLFVGVSSGNAFASQRPTHPSKVVKPSSIVHFDPGECNAYINDYSSIYASGPGNSPACNAWGLSYFSYQPVSPDNNQVTGSWDFYSSNIHSCDIDAWFPLGDFSSGTKAHYDFWDSNGWIGWVGQDINQATAPFGWYRIATNIAVRDGGAHVSVTLHNDGGWGNLAFAAMKFVCS